MKRIISILAISISAASTCLSAGWHDYRLELGDGYRIFRANSVDICISNNHRTLIGPSPSSQIGPVYGYCVIDDYIFARTFGCKMRNKFEGDMVKEVDRSKQFYFVLEKGVNAVTGPLSLQEFQQNPIAQQYSPIQWISPRNPNFWTPFLGNLMTLVFFVLFMPIKFFWITIPIIGTAIILIWVLKKKQREKVQPAINRVVRFIVMPLGWAIVLGAVGFFCGYIGPLFLNPSANLGPLLGIFFAGPVGFVLGLVCGFIMSILNLRVRTNIIYLLIASMLVAVGTLYMSTPKSRYKGTIIEAEVIGCSAPSDHITEAIAQWEKAVKNKASWREVRNTWKQDVDRMLKENDGVVLELHVFAERKIYEHRKPWNKGKLTALPWTNESSNKSFFARYNGSSCDAYPLGERKLYLLDWEASPTWPSDKLSSFLGLHVIEAVPEAYKECVGE